MKSVATLLLIACAVISSLAQTPSWTFSKKENRIIAKQTGSGKEIVIAVDAEKSTVEDGDTTTTEDKYSIVSYVGPYITLLHSNFSYMMGAAHPNSERKFEVFNANTGRTIKLTEFYSEFEIYTALLTDGLIKENLPEGAKPKNLKEIMTMIEDPCEMLFKENMIESFAFHHVENGKVAIRIGLTNNCPAANGMFTQLGIFFPIPEKIKAPLLEAATKKTLMKDLLPKINRME